MLVFAAPDELLNAIGERLGTSSYRKIHQHQVDSFSQLTGDKQWIHTDPARAGDGPFGMTIAHGFYTLSLLTSMMFEIFRVDGTDLVLNKGLDRLRFIQPVQVGTRVRAVAHLVSAACRPHGFTEATIGVTVEIEGQSRPAYTVQHRLLFHRVGAESCLNSSISKAPNHAPVDLLSQAFEKLFTTLWKDDRFREKLQVGAISLLLVHSDPTCRIFVSADTVMLGDKAPAHATLIIRCSADTAHQLWLGEITFPAAVTAGRLRINGKVSKILELIPALTPVFKIYPDILDELGIDRRQICAANNVCTPQEGL